MMNIRLQIFAVIPVLILTSGMSAQDDPAPALMKVVPAAVPLQARAATIGFQKEIMDAEPIKGIPFCATISTEHTQVFADGNRIHTSDDSTLCRDSQGRMRRDATLTLLGPGAQNPPTKLITIIDPVAGVRYMLDTNAKIARKMRFSPRVDSSSASISSRAVSDESGKAANVFFFQSAGAGAPDLVSSRVLINRAGHDQDEQRSATETLGDQTIDGIHATGTRVTTTIPAGKMGNEQPMVITSERWYSPELKATVMTKHNDPWAGELKTQFTNVNTSEPDPSLFAVPNDYKVVEEKDGPFQIKLPPPAPPAP
jgi:hypothetical protein